MKLFDAGLRQNWKVPALRSRPADENAAVVPAPSCSTPAALKISETERKSVDGDTFWKVFWNATSGEKPLPLGGFTPPSSTPPAPKLNTAPLSPLA
ncbi:hypothetical protein D9M70_615370 [compost metagenome]